MRAPRCPEILFGNMATIKGNILQSDALLTSKSILFLVDDNVAQNQNRLISELTSAMGRDRSCVIHCNSFSEPTRKRAEECSQVVKDRCGGHTDVIVAIGGGSTVDTAKLTSILVAEPTFPLPTSFTIGLPPDIHPRRIIALPTTIGPGAEVSPAAIYDGGRGKIGIVDERLVPSLAAIIPELTQTLPQEVLACSAADGIAHSLEGILSLRSTMMSDALHGTAIRVFLSDLETTLTKRDDPSSQNRLCEASLMSGIATRITGVNIIHTLASILIRIGAMSHGASVLMSMLLVLDCFERRFPVASKHISEVTGHKDAVHALCDLATILNQHLNYRIPRIDSVDNLDKGFLQGQQGRLADCRLQLEMDDVMNLARLAEGRIQGS